MIKKGDKVKFLNDVGGGIVTGFVNKNMVNVENQDGFEIPYPITQLVNLSEMEREEQQGTPEPITISEKSTILEETKEVSHSQNQILSGKDSPDFYFCFVPDDSKNPLAGETGLYLVNDSNFAVLYRFAHYRDEKYETIKYGTLNANSQVLLESIDQSDLTDLPEYAFQLLYFMEKEKELQSVATKKFKVSPVKFYKEKSFQSNVFFSKNAMVLQITPNLLSAELDNLTDDDLRRVVKAKEIQPEERTTVKKKPAETMEVDLHIQELLDDTRGLSNREILDFQLEKVESEMKSAIQSNVKKIVFIHGLGQGVLKQEVAKLLKSKFPKYYFQDASFQEYGYGATMVILRR